MASLYKALAGEKSKEVSNGKEIRRNKQRVLILSSRGVTSRQRHFMNDISIMMPHGKKEAKIDSKARLYELNEIAELYNCNNIMYFESRKHQDLYMYIARPPNGPTIKFYVQNLHTMDELNFLGNCLRGSRPILSFDSKFDIEPHNRLIKEMFIQIFGVPPNARKSKPFVDHVITFTLADDGKIWFRNYQITESSSSSDNKESTSTELLEIGPRFVLTPITIQQASFGGALIYENNQFVSPNLVRSTIKSEKAAKARMRADSTLQQKLDKQERMSKVTKQKNPLANSVLFS